MNQKKNKKSSDKPAKKSAKNKKVTGKITKKLINKKKITDKINKKLTNKEKITDRIRKKADEKEKVSLERRDILKGLATIPVFGPFLYAFLKKKLSDDFKKKIGRAHV